MSPRCSPPPAPPGQPQGRGVHTHHTPDRPRPAPAPAFDKLTDDEEVLRLPAACVDRPEHLLLRAVAGLRLRRQLPRVGQHGDDRPEGDRPDLLLRAAARVRGPAHQRHDPHGRRRPLQALAVRPGDGARPPGRPGADGRQARRHARPAALRPRQALRLRAAAQHPRLLASARRLHRRRGDRPGPLHLLPLARHQPEAALRLDRDGRVRLPAARQRSPLRHRRRADRGRGAQGRAERRDPGALARPAEGVLQEPRGDRGGAHRRRLVPHRRRGLSRCRRPREDHRPRQGCRPDLRRRSRRRALRAQVRREQAQVLPVHQGGRGLRRQARQGLRLRQHRYRGGRQLGREEEPALRQLRRPGAKARGAAARSRLRAEGQRRPRRRRQARRQPDQPLPHPAQGARRRRRRADAHPQGPPRLHRRALRRARRRALRRQERAVRRDPGQVRGRAHRQGGGDAEDRRCDDLRGGRASAA